MNETVTDTISNTLKSTQWIWAALLIGLLIYWLAKAYLFKKRK